jgi:menaquinone-9 beta-reductase
MDTDVFIIGGGPAGLAAAIAARQRGHQVTVADSNAPPIDKPCGEGLMPDSQAALAGLGIWVPAEESCPFRGIRFVSSELAVDADFPKGRGVGVRRPALHRIMVERAEEAGVKLLWRTVVTGLCDEGVLLGDEVVRSPWIVGADGANSRVRRWAGLDRYSGNRQRFAFRQHYRVAPWSEFMEIHWGRACQLYVTPVAADELCVVVISCDPGQRLEQAMRAFPVIAARLQGAERTSPQQGALSATRKLRQVCRGRVALVGDASGSVDVITGEGLCTSFRQAMLLAECLSAQSLAGYQAGHAKLARRPRFMAEFMLTMDGHDFLRRRVMRAFSRRPEIFARMLAMHVGEASAFNFAAATVALGWGTLTA